MPEMKEVVHIEKKEIALSYANPTPIGLIGFGAALLMLCFHFADFIGFNIGVSVMLLVMGFLAQFIAGVYEMRKGNSYRATAFIMSSLYFLCLSLINRYSFDVDTTDVGATIATSGYLTMGFFYAIWTVVIALLMVKMPKSHILLYVIITLFALVNLLLSIGEFAQSLTVIKVAGYFGFVTALLIIVSFVIHICNSKKKLIA